MAGIPVLDREIARLSEEQREYRKQENDAAQLHGRSISENYRKLIEPQQNEPWAEPYAYNTQAYDPAHADPALKTYDMSAPAYAPQAPSENYRPQYAPQSAPQQNYYQPVYRSDYREPEYHAPVVPSSTPGAPSAAQRLNDYVPIRAGMPLTRMGDMPSYPAQAGYASSAAPAAEKKQLFEGLTYQNGELIDNTVVAPTYDSSYVPAAPAYAPAEVGAYAGTAAPVFEEEDEDDALPTRMTLDAATRAPQRIEMTTERQENAFVAFFRSISMKAKVALACVAVLVVAMISLICVNTALLSSAEAAVLSRQEQVRMLQEQAEELQAEIDRYNSEEFINAWAEQQGMTRAD